MIVRTSRAVVLVSLIVFGSSLAACGDDGPDGATPDGEVPSPEGTMFTLGVFDDISLPRGADELGEKTERDGAIAQSFGVAATSPEIVMDYFERTLPQAGWTVLEPVAASGTQTITGSWSREGRRLDVSAGPATALEDERTQFSLVLLPNLASAASIPGG